MQTTLPSAFAARCGHAREILSREHVTLSSPGWGGGDPSCPHVFPLSLITGFPPKAAPQPSLSCRPNPAPDPGPLHSCRPHPSRPHSPCSPLLGCPFPRSPLWDCSSLSSPSVRRALKAGAGLWSAGGARRTDGRARDLLLNEQGVTVRAPHGVAPAATGGFSPRGGGLGTRVDSLEGSGETPRVSASGASWERGETARGPGEKKAQSRDTF